METLWTKNVTISHAEKEYMLAPYDPIYGLLMDYAGMHVDTALYSTHCYSIDRLHQHTSVVRKHHTS
jgi:hypothetical protein